MGNLGIQQARTSSLGSSPGHKLLCSLCFCLPPMIPIPSSGSVHTAYFTMWGEFQTLMPGRIFLGYSTVDEADVICLWCHMRMVAAKLADMVFQYRQTVVTRFFADNLTGIGPAVMVPCIFSHAPHQNPSLHSARFSHFQYEF